MIETEGLTHIHLAEVVAAGGQLAERGEPRPARYAYVSDPNGYLIEF